MEKDGAVSCALDQHSAKLATACNLDNLIASTDTLALRSKEGHSIDFLSKERPLVQHRKKDAARARR